MQILIKNASVQSATPFVGDVLLEDGVIKAMGLALDAPKDAKVIDAKQKALLPGFIDVHVHFREPGFTQKETIKTGSMAAAHGGYTTVVAMPNVKPVPDNPEDLKSLIEKNKKDGQIRVEQFAAITKERTSTEVVDMAALKELGIVGFSNDGNGIQDAETMRQAMALATKLDLPIVAHIEDEGLVAGGAVSPEAAERLGLKPINNASEAAQLARDLVLAETTNARFHMCHVSTKESVALIRDAKKRGVRVTAEVSPHHLLLDDTDIHEDDPMFKMNPPLRGRADHLALLEGLQDGTIDFIATDHAPHTISDKSGSMATAAFGIVGIENSFALLYTQFVKTKMFTLDQLIGWLSTKPADAFKLKGGRIAVGQPADVTLIDLDADDTVDPNKFFSMGTNTPFAGRKVKSRVLMTIQDGKIAYEAED